MKTPSISSRSFLYFLCLLCLLNLLLFSEAASAQDKSPTYAITHAKIFTLSGPTIDDGTIVIQNGKIANVGAAVEAPAGAQVIDGKGLQVYPGLFDPITQMGLREIGAVSATVDSAETGAFNPDVVASEAVLPSSEHIPVTRAAGITEVLAVPASGGLDSEGPTSTAPGITRWLSATAAPPTISATSSSKRSCLLPAASSPSWFSRTKPVTFAMPSSSAKSKS